MARLLPIRRSRADVQVRRNGLSSAGGEIWPSTEHGLCSGRECAADELVAGWIGGPLFDAVPRAVCGGGPISLVISRGFQLGDLED